MWIYPRFREHSESHSESAAGAGCCAAGRMEPEMCAGTGTAADGAVSRPPSPTTPGQSQPASVSSGNPDSRYGSKASDTFFTLKRFVAQKQDKEGCQVALHQHRSRISYRPPCPLPQRIASEGELRQGSVDAQRHPTLPCCKEAVWRVSQGSPATGVWFADSPSCPRTAAKRSAHLHAGQGSIRN